VESRFAEFERQQLLGQGLALRHEQQFADTAGTGGTTAGVLVGVVVRVATVGTSRIAQDADQDAAGVRQFGSKKKRRGKKDGWRSTSVLPTIVVQYVQ
jgi:hypothetical protein